MNEKNQTTQDVYTNNWGKREQTPFFYKLCLYLYTYRTFIMQGTNITGYGAMCKCKPSSQFKGHITDIHSHSPHNVLLVNVYLLVHVQCTCLSPP